MVPTHGPLEGTNYLLINLLLKICRGVKVSSQQGKFY